MRIVDIKKKFKMKRKQNFIILIILISFFFSEFLINNNISSKELTSSETHLVPRIEAPKASINFEWSDKIINDGEEIARDIVIDTEGFIYITGKIYNNSRGAYDIFLTKYNNSGSQLWNKSWNGNSDSLGYDLAIDSSQNLYITGYLKNTPLDVDIILLKYNANGEYQWNRTWGGDEWDVGYGIAVTNSNNIYIAGYTESFGVLGDVVLLMYNSTGDLQWYKTCGGTDTDSAYNLEIDSLGNIYIVGYTSSFGTATSNGYLIKYNKTGVFEWNTTWGGDLADDFYDISINYDNEILIAGNTKSYAQGGYDIAFFKYNTTGHLQSNSSWGGEENDYCYSISIDSKNNAYIVGYTQSYGGNDKDVCIVKFNNSGGFQWYRIWGSNLDDVSYGIDIDLDDNLYITGKSKTQGGNDDLFLMKYNQLPDDFILSSEVSSGIDSDGNFTLSWTNSLDALNYSLYRYDKQITEYNDSLVKIVENNINHTYSLNNFEEGTYYFMVFAHNIYGNTSSNCLKIRVIYPPKNFTLNENDQNPDTDGTVNLTWDISLGADNYSVYSHNKYIHKIDNNGTLIVSGLTNQSYLISGLTNQDIYYVILAKNLGGQTTSNCIEVIVRRAPDKFTLYTNADNPDEGIFDIIWTKSNFADNYTIYYSTSNISNINNAEKLLECFKPEFDWPSYKFKETRGTGTYYYKIVAFNEYGNYSTKCIKVFVKIPVILVPEDLDNKDSESQLDSFYIDYGIVSLIIFIGLAITLFLLYRMRAKGINILEFIKKYRKRRSK